MASGGVADNNEAIVPSAALIRYWGDSVSAQAIAFPNVMTRLKFDSNPGLTANWIPTDYGSNTTVTSSDSAYGDTLTVSAHKRDQTANIAFVGDLPEALWLMKGSLPSNPAASWELYFAYRADHEHYIAD